MENNVELMLVLGEVQPFQPEPNCLESLGRHALRHPLPSVVSEIVDVAVAAVDVAATRNFQQDGVDGNSQSEGAPLAVVAMMKPAVGVRPVNWLVSYFFQQPLKRGTRDLIQGNVMPIGVRISLGGIGLRLSVAVGHSLLPTLYGSRACRPAPVAVHSLT